MSTDKMNYNKARKTEFARFVAKMKQCGSNRSQQLRWMRKWIPKLRGRSEDEAENITAEKVEEVMDASKVLLKLLSDVSEDPFEAFEQGRFQKGREKERPKKKRKKKHNRTKQSDTKLEKFTLKKREQIDLKESTGGLRLASERLYKDLMKNHIKVDDDEDDSDQHDNDDTGVPVMKADEWLNELTDYAYI
eukprot:scaffold4497_cov125-Cylindrotheca_fusiformis.AAC.1